ncbi:fibronectin type III domain-containing protein [Flavobacterium sp.]|uniref:fibronectin type III domain-containing protein n=1 Tax=Flavobacterium sp. TaxID=239 RepID=UPI0026342C46|nr:fibronectin type III domain-containing protein [Flavobacterium sp.]
MRKKITLSLFLVLFLTISKISAQCTTGVKYPAGIHQATGAAGSDVINTDARTGQYTDVHIEPSKYYTFSSSVNTDYITITNSAGTQVIAHGVTPVSFVSVFDQTVRYYIHQNAQCQTTNQFVRSRTVTWVTAQDCQDPIPTTVANISPVSATLNFTPPAITPYFGYEAHVNTSSTTPGASVPVFTSSPTANSVFVTDLNPDTTYYYWIRSKCDYQRGEWIYGGSFTTISSLQCNSAYNGVNPSFTVTPLCNGSDDWIATDVKNSSFANVNVVANTQYVFKTNNGSDYITLTNALGTVVLATGATPLNWNSASTSGVVRFYSYDNAQCGYGITMVGTRNKYVNCVTSSVTCNPPTALSVTNITSNSIRMSWTAPTSAPSSGYDIYLVTNNTTPTQNTAPTYTNTTTTREINGLTAGVTYYYWIRSNCGAEKSSWTSGGFFTMNQSFSCNGAIYGLFPNATFTPVCTGSAETISATAFAGQYSNVNINASQQYIFASSVGTDFISITNSAGTAILATGQTPLTWNSGTNTGVIRYYLHTNANCASQNTNRTKSIQCAASVSCGVPSALSVTNITSNSSRLNWTAPATAPTGYDIYIVTTNTAPTAATAATATSTTAGVGVLNGLAAATTYYYWIRSNCNGTRSAWVSGGNFTTLNSLVCNGAVNGLYPEATFTPTCTGGVQTIVSDAYAGEYANVNVVANTQYTFSTSLASDFVTVTNALGTTVLASGTTPLNWTSGTYAGVVRFHINTNSSCGTQNTNRFRYIQCFGLASCGLPSNLAISNITSNSCSLTWSAPTTAPTGYEVYFATTNTAPVAATAPTYSTAATVINSVNPLTAATTYYYWVRSNCNGTKSNWVAGGSFTTLTALSCNGASFGLFPTATFTPSCSGNLELIVNNAYAGEYSNVNILINKQYTFTSSTTTDFITITNAAGTAVLASGVTPVVWNSTYSGVIRYYLSLNANCGSQGTSRVRYITCATPTGCNPPTNLYSDGVTSNSINIGWIAANPVPSNGYIYAYGTVNDPFAAGTISGNTTANFATLSNLSPNTTYYFWVKSNCGTTQTNWVSGGSFTTYATNACFPPTQLFTDGLTATSVNIGWAAPTPAPSNGYIYAYGTVNDPFSAATITVNTSNTFAVINNLTPNTTYYFWVKSNCGTTQTNWVSGGSFTTPAASGCGLPTQLFSDPESSTAVNIAWTAPNPAPSNGYVYAYGTINDPFATGTIQGSTSQTFALLTNLTPNTTYYFWVKSICGNTVTNWSPSSSFTTAAAAGCNAPTQLFTDPESSTAVNIVWNAASPVPNNGYVYAYGTINDPFAAGTMQGSTSQTFALLSNLTPNTTYYFWVKSICDNTVTDWSPSGTFTTSTLGTDSFLKEQVKLYPNPVSTVFNIALNKTITNVAVHNLLGQEVLSKAVNSTETSVDVSHLAAGSYLVKITSGNETKTVKIIKM